MTSVRYEATTHRLRIEGVCREDARHAIDEALEAFAPMAGDHLIVDLTGVTDIDEDVVDALVAKARTAGTKEKTLTFVRKQGSIVDQAIVAAETALS